MAEQLILKGTLEGHVSLRPDLAIQIVIQFIAAATACGRIDDAPPMHETNNQLQQERQRRFWWTRKFCGRIS